VEIIVNVAFATIPSILGIGAAGLLGLGIINTAKEVRNSISLLKTVGPMAQLGWMAGKGLNTLRKGTAERWRQSGNPVLKGIGIGLAPVQWYKSKRGKNNQDTQGKQEGQSGVDSKIILPEEFLKSGKLPSLEEHLKSLKSQESLKKK
jgi:hypothetical protein